MLAVLAPLFVAQLTERAALWPAAQSASATVQDLHREYGNIFRHGNRNAASHLWASFLLERAPQMTAERLELMFSGFCAVSGSPVRPSDYTRYRLSLPLVSGGVRAGYMYYCCWPCVCDTQDFIRVDTRNVTTAEGERQYHWAVVGNPCTNPGALDEPFVQPFYQRGETTLRREAPEVRCQGGVLQGASLSDNGYVIISRFFDADDSSDESAAASDQQQQLTAVRDPTPGRLSESLGGISFQDEAEFGPMCQERAANGYNSGMGEIFRKVAAISPVQLAPTHNQSAMLESPPQGDQSSCDAANA
tara:strand:- start:256 stop:1167 length:912 start_codon:yes stop_codon:yes gene_type:complete